MRSIVVGRWTAVGIAAGWLAYGATEAAAEPKTLTAREAFGIATEAYIYGYPLITMEMTRRVMTNVREPEAMRAPMGQFARIRSYPLASNHEISVPNADTLTSVLWIDVSREPWVLSLPDMKDRYTTFTLLDGWTTVFATLGKRTTGAGPAKCVITGPGWKGKLPSGLKKYESPTGIVRVIGRIYCSGTPEDYAAVHGLQDQCSAEPLSSYGQPYTPLSGQVDPGIDMKRPVREQVNSLSVADYFNRLAFIMKENPPTHADKQVVKKMARLGIVPGQPFVIAKLSPAAIEVLEAVPNEAVNKLIAWSKAGTNAGDWRSQSGWSWTLKTGVYGSDYTQRPVIAAISLGACRPEDFVVAASTVDGAGLTYTGNRRYVLHFPAGQTPSANGFWSLTMYDSDCFFVDNPMGRYALNGHDNLTFNPDGALDIKIQRYTPGTEWEHNWLPAPEGKFILMMRFYWPKETLLNGSWKMPAVKRVD